MNIATYIGGPIQTKAYRILRARVYACLEQYNLNPTSWALLGLIYSATDGIRLAEAARILGVKAPLITALADDLSVQKRIKRIPHHLDQRAKLLVITAPGKKVVKVVEADLADQLSKLLKGVTSKDMATYHKVLQTIITNGS